MADDSGLRTDRVGKTGKGKKQEDTRAARDADRVLSGGLRPPLPVRADVGDRESLLVLQL